MSTRWNDVGLGDLDRSFSALNDLRREMDRLFADLERGWGYDPPDARLRRGAIGTAAWPAVRLYDAGTELRLLAEVPGLTNEDIDVTLDQGSLTIRGQRTVDAPEGYSVHRQERGPLAFARSFMLPSRVDVEKVRAELKNGILEMTLPKVAEEQPRQIQVRGS